MKLTIKNLQNETFTVECHPDDLVKVLKGKIAETKDVPQKYDPELLKLLYSGKVMDDDETVESYAIKPDTFLVLVKQTPGKPKPPPKKKPNQFNQMGGFGNMQNPFGGGLNSFGGMGSFGNIGGPGSFGNIGGPGSFGDIGSFGNPGSFGGPGKHGASAYGDGSTYGGASTYGGTGTIGGSGSSQSSTLGQSTNFPASAATGTGLEGTTPEDFSTPEDREEAIQTLMMMGFEKSQAEKALRASYYNVQVAADLLLSGNIPEVSQPPAAPTGLGAGLPSSGSTLPSSQPTPSPSLHQQGGGFGGMGTNIQQLRQMLQQHPEQLQVLKQRVQAEHPELAQLIGDDPQQFLQLLEQASNMSGGGASLGTGLGVGAGAGAGAGQIRVTLTNEEQQKIDRLQDLGFDRNRAIEAFLACGRDENAAANYLFTVTD